MFLDRINKINRIKMREVVLSSHSCRKEFLTIPPYNYNS